MQIPLRISPLNSRFVAALYLGGGVGVLLAAFSRRRSEARLFVFGFGLVTGLILVLTLLHWSDFMADPLPHRPVWMFDYVVDPLLAVVLVVFAHMLPAARSVRHALTPLLIAEAVVFGALGLLLLLLPDMAAALWPWALPPLLGQLYSCFVLTFAVGAGLAARESSPRAVRDFLIASLALAVLVLCVSVLHFDRFKSEPVTAVWFAAFGIAAVAFGVGAYVQGRSIGWRSTIQAPSQI
jgi:hypothetical protein